MILVLTGIGVTSTLSAIFEVFEQVSVVALGGAAALRVATVGCAALWLRAPATVD